MHCLRHIGSMNRVVVRVRVVVTLLEQSCSFPPLCTSKPRDPYESSSIQVSLVPLEEVKNEREREKVERFNGKKRINAIVMRRMMMIIIIWKVRYSLWDTSERMKEPRRSDYYQGEKRTVITDVGYDPGTTHWLDTFLIISNFLSLSPTHYDIIHSVTWREKKEWKGKKERWNCATIMNRNLMHHQNKESSLSLKGRGTQDEEGRKGKLLMT